MDVSTEVEKKTTASAETEQATVDRDYQLPVVVAKPKARLLSMDNAGAIERYSPTLQIEEAGKEERFEVISSIRDNIRNLPAERYTEIFADFEIAVESKDIGHLADTVVNWALGGHGYKYAGGIVNRSLDALPDFSSDADLSAAWEAYKAIE